jgi:hypothetical protein
MQFFILKIFLFFLHYVSERERTVQKINNKRFVRPANQF